MSPLIAVAASLSGAASAFAANPTHNTPPPYPYGAVCDNNTDAQDATCKDTLLEDINAARANEGRVAMKLPGNYPSLTTSQQLFVITNSERVARGEQPITGTSQTIASAEGTLASEQKENSQYINVSGITNAQIEPAIFATAVLNPLIADYIMMYEDGWGGSPGNTLNKDCTSATAPGCWGHRDNILYIPNYGYNVTAAGGGGSTNGSNTYDFLSTFGTKSGSGPSYSYLWSTAVANGAV